MPWTLRYYPKAQIRQGADRVSDPPAKGWGSGLAEVGGLFHTKISVTFEPITSEQATNGRQRLLLIPERASK